MPKKKKALTIEERLQQALVPAEEQPYEVPENWVWVRLLSTFINKTDSKKKIQQKSYLNTGNYAVVDQGQNLIGGYTDDASLQYDGELPVVVFGDHTRCVKYIDFKFVQGADGVKILLPVKSYDSKFFYYAIMNLNIPNMGYRRHFPLFDKLSLPLPPLSEQQRIVERIEELFAKLDEAKERLQEVADSFAVRKAAILHKAFTGELTKQWRRENGVSDASWEEKKLHEVAFVQTGVMKGKHYNGETKLLPYLRVANVQDGYLKLDEIKEIAIDVNLIERYSLRKGDVLFTEGGDYDKLGRGTVWNNEIPGCLHQNHVFAVRPNTSILFDCFLAYQSNSRYGKKYFLSCSKQTTNLASINSTQLKNFPVLLPSLPEQHEIVRLIDDLLARERAAQQAAEQALASIDLMKKSILARAFRGELGTNKASEASALELLRQVLAES